MVASTARWSEPGLTVLIDDAAAFRVSTWSIVMTEGIQMRDGKVGDHPAPVCGRRRGTRWSTVAELAHVGGAVEVTGDDYGGWSGDVGGVVQFFLQWWFRLAIGE